MVEQLRNLALSYDELEATPNLEGQEQRHRKAYAVRTRFKKKNRRFDGREALARR